MEYDQSYGRPYDLNDYDMPTTPQTPNWWESFTPAPGGYDPIGDYLRTGGVEGSIQGGGTGGGAGSVGGAGAGFETFLRNIPGTLARYLGGGGGGPNPQGGGGGPGIGGGLAALIAALAARNSRQQPTGGGVGVAYGGPRPVTRTIEQGRYGPIARYAAQGGLMQAYAQGGAVRPFPMQDGGFVLTKEAVDGADGMDGVRAIIPEAVPIVGPGDGTSDSIPAYIQGKHGRTPAAVSNGEAYIPPGRDTKGLYALMKHLERKA